MNLLINPTIVIQEPKRNKNFGYYVTLDKDNKTILKIKGKSSDGRSRGIVGTITPDGSINTDPKVMKLITPELRNKINFVLDIAFGMKRENLECKMINGLLSFK